MRKFALLLILIPVAGIALASVVARKEEPAAESDSLIARRRYESLMKGKRAATIEVVWTDLVVDGEPAVKDVTRTRSRTARAMGSAQDVFEQESISIALRTTDGDLLYQTSATVFPGRIDQSRVVRVENGYHVRTTVGSNVEEFVIETGGPAILDPEAFLGERILAGEALPGSKFVCRRLNLRKRELTDVELEVVGEDDEGPGLKVIETSEGFRTLWWFDKDGSVVRLRSGDTVIRRDDDVDLEDLPRAPPSFSITLRSDRNLPRLFTTEEMEVELSVRTDETTEAPRIALNPFTEVLDYKRDRVLLKLKSYDNQDAKATLPVDRTRFEKYLKATPLMEVDDPVVVNAAREAIGDERDARKAAELVADFVFRGLKKQSPEIGELTAKEILSRRIGDCSEHARLFVALCRAGGIPARRCSGYVCIGENWGAHAWSEIWVGEWIGADPTTNEVGTRARYIFTSREDDPDTRPASINAERSRISVRRARYPDGELDFEADEIDPVVFSGIRLGPLPDGWEVTRRDASTLISSEGFRIYLAIHPDQGYRSIDLLGRHLGRAERTTFGGRPALKSRYRGGRVDWLVPLGRQNLQVIVRPGQGEPVPVGRLEELLKPTLDRVDG